MPDYSKSNNKPKNENEDSTEKPKKHIPKVVEGEVIIKKHSLGRKVKDIVLSVDIKDIGRHVFRDVILPWSAKMAIDAWSETGNRIFMPHAPRRPIIDPRNMQRAIYNYGNISNLNPISRASSIPLSGGRVAPPREIGPRTAMPTQHASRDGEQYVFPSKEDAVRVIEQLRDALDQYEEPINLNDFYSACGREDLFSPVNQNWGWSDLSSVKVLQSREGYILDFPKAEPIT